MSDIRRPSGADVYVLECVRAIATGAQAQAPAATMAAADDSGWIEVAGRQGVLPVVASLLAVAGRGVPRRAQVARHAALAGAMRAVAELQLIGDALDREGVAWAVFKGPALGEVYPAAFTRGFGDLDVLVSPRDFERVLDILPACGAQPWDRHWRLIRRSGRGEMSWVLKGGTLLDLHWSLLNDPRHRARFRVDSKAILGRRRRVEFGGFSAPTFDPLDSIVHLGLHGSLAGGHTLRWLLDLQRAVRHHDVEPGELAARAEAWRADLALYALLRRAAQWIDPELRRWMPGRSTNTWLRLAASWSYAHPPHRWNGGGGSGRALFQATRDSTTASARALIHEAGRRLADGVAEAMRIGPRAYPPLQLHHDAGTDADRRAYLAYVAASGSRAEAAR